MGQTLRSRGAWLALKVSRVDEREREKLIKKGKKKCIVISGSINTKPFIIFAFILICSDVLVYGSIILTS